MAASWDRLGCGPRAAPIARISARITAVCPTGSRLLPGTAIAAATLKHLGRADGLRVTAKLTGLLADERLHGVIDHFVRLLDFSPSELQRASADTDGHLLPRLRAVNSPVAIFIDGVDEYFNKHIESRASLPSVTGPLSPDVWYFAQLGLVEVAYQLRRINHHLKVFAAIRKEAYARLSATVMSQ